jgi:hypothetical protein
MTFFVRSGWLSLAPGLPMLHQVKVAIAQVSGRNSKWGRNLMFDCSGKRRPTWRPKNERKMTVVIRI